MNSSSSAHSLTALSSPDARSRSWRPSRPLVELGHQRGRLRDEASHVPHRHRRCGRVDVTKPHDEAHHERRVAHRGGHGAEDADRQRRHVGDEDVVREEIAEVGVHQVEVPIGELPVGQRAQVGAVVAQHLRRDLIVDQLGQILGRQRPPERLADALGLVEIDIARLLRRTAGCRAACRRTARPSPGQTAQARAPQRVGSTTR